MTPRPVRPGATRRATRRATGLVPGLLAPLVLLAACGEQDTGAAGSGGPDLSGELTVLAAASLTESFTQLAEQFETEHPDADVTLAFDSSATLAEQVAQGAPADVLATADEQTMRSAVDAGATDGEPEIFATNQLVLVVPAGNPAGIERLADLEGGGVDYVVCVASAPCGVLARTLLEEEGVTAAPASEEVDVKAVLSKVQLDEADAGLVYASDAVAAGETVGRIEVPAGDGATRYPIAPVAGAAEPDLAAAWVDLVTSPAGQDVLAAAGLGPPRP